jgi:putative transposase
MHFEKDEIYHIYNRSNEQVFFEVRNYLFFLDKVRKLIFPICDILAWCLMPNHFHFMVVANQKSVELTNETHRPVLQVLAKNIGTTLSSYTKAINKANHRRGSLFSHNTKAKKINSEDDHLANCFYYIHQNPMNARLVKKLEDWEFSSFKDYAGLRSGSLCNNELADEIVEFDTKKFYEQSYAIIDEKKIQIIW